MGKAAAPSAIAVSNGRGSLVLASYAGAARYEPNHPEFMKIFPGFYAYLSVRIPTTVIDPSERGGRGEKLGIVYLEEDEKEKEDVVSKLAKVVAFYGDYIFEGIDTGESGENSKGYWVPHWSDKVKPPWEGEISLTHNTMQTSGGLAPRKFNSIYYFKDGKVYPSPLWLAWSIYKAYGGGREAQGGTLEPVLVQAHLLATPEKIVQVSTRGGVCDRALAGVWPGSSPLAEEAFVGGLAQLRWLHKEMIARDRNSKAGADYNAIADIASDEIECADLLAFAAYVVEGSPLSGYHRRSGSQKRWTADPTTEAILVQRQPNGTVETTVFRGKELEDAVNAGMPDFSTLGK